MKKTLHIARNEVYSLFYSPIAWVILIFFILLISASYIGASDRLIGILQRGGYGLRQAENLTSKITSGQGGYMLKIIGSLYLFLPLITMGLISRETSSGTIKLLYSSPVKIWQIVVGKYLAMLCFVLAMMLIVIIITIALSFSIDNPDYGQLLASLFGITLVICAYAAIGLFISSLTSYMIVAGVVTFALFMFFSIVGELWQDVDWLRDITYYLNINSKIYLTIKGLLNLRDIAYFLILIATFLLFTIIRLKSATESISFGRKFLRYAVVIAAAFAIGFITSRPYINKYLDSTRAQVFTLSPSTQQLLGQLNEDKLKVTLYCNLLHSRFGYLPPSSHNKIKEMWDPYLRFKPDIDINFVYYYDVEPESSHYKLHPDKSLKEIAQERAETFSMNIDKFLMPEEIKKEVDVEKELYRNFYVVTYKGKSTILRTFDDNIFFPLEDQIAAALKHFLIPPPKVIFLTDNLARGPFSIRLRDYRSLANNLGNRNSLVNQGYDFDSVSISKGYSIPLDAAALVIADPRTPYSEDQLSNIYKYIDGGGNLLLTCEPDKKEVTAPILEKLGLKLRDGMLIQPGIRSSDYVFSYVTDSGRNLAPQFASFLSDEIRYSGDSISRVAMPGVSAIDYSTNKGWRIDPLLVTDPHKSWNRVSAVNADSLQLEVSRNDGDESGPFATVVKLSRNINGKEQRIIVTGDADYLTHVNLYGRKPLRQNSPFAIYTFSHFTYGQFPANTVMPEPLDNSFKITVKDLPKQKMLLYWIFPILIGATGSILLIRRKRK